MTCISRWRKLAYVLVGVAAAGFLGGAAFGQRILIDDFSDGNDDGWIHFDFLEEYGPGIFDAESGEYYLASPVPLPPDFPGLLLSVWHKSLVDPYYAEAFWRSAIRANTENSAPALGMRFDTEAGRGYGFVADPSFGGFAILRCDGFPDCPILDTLDPEQFPFRLNEDWIIEAGAVGDELSLKVWRKDDPEPDDPQLTVVDATYSEGALAVGVVHMPGVESRLSGTFDDIYFTHALCTQRSRLRAKCKVRNEANRIVAKLRGGVPERMVTFRLDGDPESDLKGAVDDNGRAKVKFRGVSRGSHTVEIVHCRPKAEVDCP